MRSVKVLAALLCAAQSVTAGAAPRTGVIAPLNPLGIDAEEVAKVQRWITAACAAVPGYRWLTSGRLERQLQLPRNQSCAEDPPCLAKLARPLGSEMVVSGDVGSLSGAYMVYLRLIDNEGRVVRSSSGVLDPRAGLRDAADALVLQLLVPEQYVGALNVVADVPNAWIYLDGQRVAHSPAGMLERVAVGTHALRVTHEAYREYVRFVQVRFRQTTQVDARLRAFPIESGVMKLRESQGEAGALADHELPWYRRWWAVATFGAVIFGAATATVAVLASRSVAHDAEAVVRP